MKTQMMAYLLYLTVTLTVLSFNNVFTQLHSNPEISDTCSIMCGSEIQQIYHLITHLKDNISTLEEKQDMQTKIDSMETKVGGMQHQIDTMKEKEEDMESKIEDMRLNEDGMQHKIQAMQLKEEDMQTRMNAMMVKEESMQSLLDAMQIKEDALQSLINALGNSDVRDLIEQNKNLTELNTNCTIIAEKYLHQQKEIDDLRDQYSVLKGNISSLAEENEDLTELKTNRTIIAEKYLHQQKEIDDLKDKNSALKGNISSLAEENEDLTELKTNFTIIAEKYLHQKTEIDDLRNTNNAFQGNISSLQSENLALEQRINKLKSILPKNCADLYKYGLHEDTVYNFHNGGKSHQLYCDMTQDGGGWTVIQRRFDGSVDFYRNWDTYKTGFGNLTTEFWLGNDLISLLTKNNTFNLHIYLEDHEGDHRYAEYSDFRLGDEDEKYALHIRSYSGNAGDSLTYHKGMKFSTYDHDNDISSGTNCASARHGAFWFNGCDRAHLNGQYSTTGSGVGSEQGLVWDYWKGTGYSLKKTIIKMRPMNF